MSNELTHDELRRLAEYDFGPPKHGREFFTGKDGALWYRHEVGPCEGHRAPDYAHDANAAVRLVEKVAVEFGVRIWMKPTFDFETERIASTLRWEAKWHNGLRTERFEHTSFPLAACRAVLAVLEKQK